MCFSILPKNNNNTENLLRYICSIIKQSSDNGWKPFECCTKTLVLSTVIPKYWVNFKYRNWYKKWQKGITKRIRINQCVRRPIYYKLVEYICISGGGKHIMCNKYYVV